MVRNFVNGIIEELCDVLIRAEGAVRSTLLVALAAQTTSHDRDRCNAIRQNRGWHVAYQEALLIVAAALFLVIVSGVVTKRLLQEVFRLFDCEIVAHFGEVLSGLSEEANNVRVAARVAAVVFAMHLAIAKLIFQDVVCFHKFDVAVVRDLVDGMIEEFCDVLVRAEGAVPSTLLVALTGNTGGTRQ